MNNETNAGAAAAATPDTIAAATAAGAEAVRTGSVEKATIQLGNDRIELSRPRERMKLIGSFSLGTLVGAGALWGAKRYFGLQF